jgi:hypothetical protein
MHGKRSPVREVYYGSDGERLYLRIDFHESKEKTLGKGVLTSVQHGKLWKRISARNESASGTDRATIVVSDGEIRSRAREHRKLPASEARARGADEML